MTGPYKKTTKLKNIRWIEKTLKEKLIKIKKGNLSKKCEYVIIRKQEMKQITRIIRVEDKTEREKN